MTTPSSNLVRLDSEPSISFSCRNKQGQFFGYTDLSYQRFNETFPCHCVYLNFEASQRPNTLAYSVHVYSVSINQIRQLEFSITGIPATGLTYRSIVPVMFPQQATVTRIQHLMDGSQMFVEE